MAIRLFVTRQDDASAATVEYCFAGPLVSIGSDQFAALRLRGPGIAAEQAIIITIEDGAPLLINRAPGTQLNGARLARETQQPLADADRLVMGAYLIECRWYESVGESLADAEPATAPPAAARDAVTSFEQVLDKLRTSDDSFHFQLDDGARLILEGHAAARQLGWNASAQVALEGAERLVAACALVRKDWSGVFIEPNGHSRITVNGEPLHGVRQLRHGDRLACIVAAGPQQPMRRANLIFCEPVSLTVLDNLLAGVALPAPVIASEPSIEAFATVNKQDRAAPGTATKEYFGAFTMFELLLMALGTFIGAALVFLLLTGW